VVSTGCVDIGGQEHFYLEGQIAYALPAEDDHVVVHCATQHPSEVQLGWQVAVDDAGRITAASFDHLVRCGWSADYSGAVADRAVFHATNAYFVPHFHCTSFRARTHTQSAAAFRGFGGPQGVLGMEVAMQDLALKLGIDALDLRKRNFLTRGERARLHYGFVLEDNVLPALVDRLEQDCGYRARRLAGAPSRHSTAAAAGSAVALRRCRRCLAWALAPPVSTRPAR